MIALNEIIKDRELFEKRYKLKGLKVDFDKIFALTSKMKELQLTTENMRASCNKLCGSVALQKNKQADIKPLLSEIEALDSAINKNNSVLCKINHKLNKQLESLHNLPLDENMVDEEILTASKTCSRKDVEEFFNQIIPTISSNLKIDKHLKSMQNINSFKGIQIICCKDGYLFLMEHSLIKTVINDLLTFFKLETIKVIKQSLKKLPKHSACTYVVSLNQNETLYLEIVGEYYSREFKIKYHDQSSDMTKFVSQLNVYIKTK